MKIFFAVLFGLFFITPIFADNTVTGSGNECVYDTLSTYTGPSTIKANWNPNTINLYWYSDNQRLSVQTAAQTCSYDGSIILPTTNPTKTGFTFTGWEVSDGIPDEYTRVEYIESTGTQYIKTGIHQNTSLNSVETRVGFGYSVLPTDRQLMGFSGNKDNYFGVYLATDKLVFDLSPATRGTYAIVANTKYDIYTKQVSTGITLQSYLNGTLVENIMSEYVPGFDTSELYLFRLSDPNWEERFIVKRGRLYYYQVFMNNRVVLDMVPVVNQSNVACMYDKVSGQCFYNSGTGSFITGPVVP